VKGIFTQEGFSTPVKNRIIAENQQIVRVDYEHMAPMPESLEKRVVEALPALLQGVAVIAISDYGKGFLSKPLLAGIIRLGIQYGIPIIADPKGTDFAKYNGSTIIKPNLSEAYAAAGAAHDTPLEHVADKVLQMVQAEILMVTRSEAGISLFHKNGNRHDFPVKVREVKDVTGAGDTVLAMLACATAQGLPIDEAVQLSNFAAGIAIERFGCARVTLSDVARRLLDHDVVNKVFDEDHLFALQEALREKKYIVLGVFAAHGLSIALFHAIKNLACKAEHDFLIYLQNDDLVEVLASLHDVNFIIQKGECLHELCKAIPPKEIFAFNDQSLTRIESIVDLCDYRLLKSS
jgi:D-glycero-beta-D-manno-heptose-7-phosphate kinase